MELSKELTQKIQEINSVFPVTHRISRKEQNLLFAYVASLRSTCNRRRYGAIIEKDNVIISTGYNGSPSGKPNCCDCGPCERQKKNIPQGQGYSECVAVHAEVNAIIKAGKECKGATLYLVGFDVEKNCLVENTAPCSICMPIIINAGIRRIVTIAGETEIFIERRVVSSYEAG